MEKLSGLRVSKRPQPKAAQQQRRTLANRSSVARTHDLAQDVC